MKSVEFCYWLQGMFELTEPKQLDEKQTELIRRHLAMVFRHEIDPSYPQGQQPALSAIHAGHKNPAPDAVAPAGPNPPCHHDVVLRC